MSKILVFTELTQDNVKNVTIEILGKLTNEEVDVACIGNLPEAGLKNLTEYGASNVHKINGPGLDKYSPEGYATALKNIIDDGQYDYVMAGATSLGKDLFPRLAGMLHSGMASEVTSFTMDSGIFSGTRPLFAGKVLSKVEIQGPKPHIVTVRPNALGMPTSTNPASSNTHEVTAETTDIRATIKEIIKGASEKLDLSEANIIISGGRAMKNSENFKILDECAEVLGATVGASRAAVDSGFAPHSMQVGQTGKTVAPTLYIACGISGAIQHLAGMRTSKVIVAINTDPDAPIFTKADYGIVGDLFKIVPLLTEEFKKIL